MQINQRHQLIYGTLTVFLSLQGTEAPKEHVATGDQTLPWRRCRRPTALRMQIRRVVGHSTTFKKRKQEHKETQLIRVIQHTPVQS